MPPEVVALQNANIKMQAAQLFYAARMQDYEASMLVGTPSELELARIGAVSGLESFLDTRLVFHRAQTAFNNRDPREDA